MEPRHSETSGEEIHIYPGENDRLLVQFSYSQERVEKIKTIPGRKSEPDIKCCSLPRTKGSVRKTGNLVKSEGDRG